MRIIGFSPWSSDSRYITPFSSGSSKSGRVIPGWSFALMSVLLLGSDAWDLKSNPVDAGERRDVQRLSVGIAPGEVVWRLGQAQGAEVLAAGRDHPDPAGTTCVQVARDVDLEPVDRVLPLGVRH